MKGETVEIVATLLADVETTATEETTQIWMILKWMTGNVFTIMRVKPLLEGVFSYNRSINTKNVNTASCMTEIWGNTNILKNTWKKIKYQYVVAPDGKDNKCFIFLIQVSNGRNQTF